MDNDILKSLNLLGLNKNESKVYLTLYGLGSSKVGDLVKITLIPRATVYQILENLVNLGLVLKIDKKNILHYIAEEPEQFLKNLINEEENILRKKKILNYILPKITKLKNPSYQKSKVVYFEGIQSYISLLNDVLDSKEKEIFMITNSEINSKHFADEVKHKDIFEYEEGEFLKERLKRKIKLNLITSKNDIGVELIGKDKNELRITKILPPDFGDVESLVIYGDKLLLLTDNNPVIGIYIEDIQLKNMFKNIFNFIWKNIN